MITASFCNNWHPVFLILVALSFCLCHTAVNQTKTEDSDIIGNCSTNEFDCGEKCIPMQRFRDCNQDCADGSDEVCWPGFVRCKKVDSVCACVKQSDADLLCFERKESKFCSWPQKDIIFHCANGNCILKSWVNDKKNDCGDWSDEQQMMTALQPVN